jgi:hypothetical protein
MKTEVDSKLSVSYPTVDELVSMLKRSQLKTVIVEGKDDAYIYRWIERNIEIPNVDVLRCNGRSTLLKLYERRAEYNHLKTVFVADRDMWLFTAVPQEYNSIVWTTGYSIENDIFASSTEVIDRIMDLDEKNKKDEMIALLCIWFAYEVEKYRNTGEYNINHHINFIFNSDKSALDSNYLRHINYSQPEENTLNEIIDNKELKIRGKNLFEVVLYLLSSKNRKSKFSRENLLELCLKLGFNEGTYIKKLFEKISISLAS